MLKNILNLTGAQQLDKKEQKGIQGGQFCVIHCIGECYTGALNQSEITACENECKQLATENGGFFQNYMRKANSSYNYVYK